MKVFLLPLVVAVSVTSASSLPASHTKRWIPLKAKQGDEPKILGLEDLGLVKENLKEAAANGVILQAIAIQSDQVEDDFCEPLILRFNISFLNYCKYVMDQDCNYLDSLMKDMGEEISARYRKEFDTLFLELSMKIGETLRILELIAKEGTDAEIGHSVVKRQFDVVAIALAGAATATSITALGISISNKLKIDTIQDALKKSEGAINAHDDEILQNREDIITVQRDVQQNAVDIESIYKMAAVNNRNIAAVKFGLALESAVERNFVELRSAVFRAMNYGELSPILVPANRLLRGLRSNKGTSVASASIYNVYRQAFYQLGRLHIVGAFKNTSTILASACYPLILQSNLRVLYKVISVGAVTNQSDVLAIPRTPDYVSFPFFSNSFDEAAYPDRSKCSSDKSFIIRCPPMQGHEAKSTPQCTVNPGNPQAKCTWDLYKIPPLSQKIYVSSVRVGSSFYIVTNAKDYQIVSPQAHGVAIHTPYLPVQKTLDIYQIPAGGYIVFDKTEVIYGVEEIDVVPYLPPKLMIRIDNSTKTLLENDDVAVAVQKAVRDSEVHLQSAKGRKFNQHKVHFDFTGHWSFFTIFGIVAMVLLVVLLTCCCVWFKRK